ncbi:MAG: hypothetical protein KF729_09265 [Sandaracinaceae bacterium]|nr:hypothetical protein [Sandaracinaceae bacterium]
MSVEIEVTLGRARLVAGEDASFRLTVANRGAADATVRDPALDGEWPKLEVLEPSGFRVAHAGRHDRTRAASHDFLPPPLPERVTLAPGQAAEADERLLAWVGPLAPGRYEVRAHLEADGLALRSATVPLEVDPLAPADVELVGPHAGPADLAYALVTHEERDGSRELLSWLHELDFEGHLHAVAVQRLGRVGHDARGSVTRAGSPYPGQWIVWVEAGRLAGFFHLQGRALARLDAPLPPGAALVGPALVELEGCDGSAPPRAEVLVHTPGRAFVACVAPDGAVREGASWALEGELEWGRATLPEANVREAFVALRRRDALEIVRLAWDADGDPASPQPIATRPLGRVLGADAALGPDGRAAGALVTRAPRGEGEPTDRYELVRFVLDAGGRPEVSARALAFDPPRDFVRALVGARGDGEASALLQGVGGAYFTATAAGLVAAPRLAGAPLAVRYWGGAPWALAGVDRGLAWQRLG